MAKKISPKSTTMAQQIRRAAKASRSMTVRERLQVMLKAGLVTREQAEKSTQLETSGKPE
jgi:hypothetical protein